MIVVSAIMLHRSYQSLGTRITFNYVIVYGEREEEQGIAGRVHEELE